MLLLSAGCGLRAGSPSATDDGPLAEISSEDRGRFERAAAYLRHELLDRETVPAPTLSFTPQTQVRGELRLTVAPLLAERQAWNAWPDGTARLFNDSVGYVWAVRIEAPRPVRWSPVGTALAVNDTEQVFPVAATPDEVLVHLVRGAAWEAAVGKRADFALRARKADGFRRAYLNAADRVGIQEGILIFPAPTRNIHAVAMNLVIGLVVDDLETETFTFLFE